MGTLAARRFAAAVFALVLGLLVAPAFASPYTVSGVEIDAEADSAFAAQRNALARGQTRAAQMLVDRLTLVEDRMEAGLPPIDPDTAAQLIAGLQIADEQRSATRYRASVTVEFDPRAVRRYLGQMEIPFVESQAAPVLVVPVFEGERGAQIFGGPWYEAWLEGEFGDALTPMVALGSRSQMDGSPLGRGLITPGAALSLDAPALRALAEAYGVDAVAVLRARTSGGAVRAGGDIVRFSAGEDGEGPAVEPVASQIVNGFEQAAAAIVAARQEAWKRQAVVRGGETAELSVTILFNSLREWRDLQNAVAGASLISNARLDALSRTGAAMTITHRGAREQLRAELAARGAVFSEDPDLGWTVRRR
ncbi:MAG: DUF2066 domain-containing protein [Oceanicaulis sp.]